MNKKQKPEKTSLTQSEIQLMERLFDSKITELEMGLRMWDQAAASLIDYMERASLQMPTFISGAHQRGDLSMVQKSFEHLLLLTKHYNEASGQRIGRSLTSSDCFADLYRRLPTTVWSRLMREASEEPIFTHWDQIQKFIAEIMIQGLAKDKFALAG